MAPRTLAPFASALSFIGVLLLGYGEASAGPPVPPVGVEAPEQTPMIANGSPVGECAWPTAVSVSSGGGLCTGTLIHPELVVYAAHCGAGNKTIRFGESAFDGGQTAAISFCKTNPDYGGTNDQGHDWAFCRLQEPVTGIPITPPVAGPCENTILQVGAEVAVTGFGQTLQGQAGTKNWGLTQLSLVNKAANITVLGGPGTASVCPGDSGGPALIQFPDGSWHAFGIASTVTGACGGNGTHSLLEGALPWLEAESGLDLTPCTDTNGNWAPGPGCGGYNSLAPNQGSGTWANWCDGIPVSAASDVCGPAWDDFDDTLLPTVAITSPVWGQMFPANASLDIVIDAVKHPDGFSIKEVRIKINGAEVATDAADPYLFKNATFGPTGVYTMVAVAEDWAGNIVESDPVAIGVGDAEVPPEMEPDPDPDPTGETGGEGTTDGDTGAESGSGETGGTGAAADADSGGCRVEPSTPSGGWLLVGLGLLGLRRRRD